MISYILFEDLLKNQNLTSAGFVTNFQNFSPKTISQYLADLENIDFYFFFLTKFGMQIDQENLLHQ